MASTAHHESSVSSPSPSEPAPYTITRHYYKGTTRTEQSLDVYEPMATTRAAASSSRPTVVLVMGSGWLGHQWWIYTGTNWWNASGAATFARLGYRTISVRHSGGFFQVPSLFSNLPASIVAASLGLIVVFVQMLHQRQQLQLLQPFGIPCGAIMLLGIFLKWQGQGAAQLDDMIEDVIDALYFIHTELRMVKDDDSSTTTPQKQSKSSPLLDQSIVLGGYSSGGHVVATLLSTPHHYAKLQHKLDQQHQQRQACSPPLEAWIQGIFYLSGVLSLDSWLVNFVTLTVFGKWARQIPSPYTAQPRNRCQPLPPPSFPFRHLILGCRHETFGVPVLDATFCAKAYAHYLNHKSSQHHSSATAIPQAQCVLVDSNHWSVLHSRALSKALSEHLPWLWTTDRTNSKEDNHEAGATETTRSSPPENVASQKAPPKSFSSSPPSRTQSMSSSYEE